MARLSKDWFRRSSNKSKSTTQTAMPFHSCLRSKGIQDFFLDYELYVFITIMGWNIIDIKYHSDNYLFVLGNYYRYRVTSSYKISFPKDWMQQIRSWKAIYSRWIESWYYFFTFNLYQIFIFIKWNFNRRRTDWLQRKL